MSSGLFSGRRLMWLPLEADWSNPQAGDRLCCEEMRLGLTFSCDQHDSPFDCADALLIYNRVFDEVGLIIHDGGISYLLITHCPWCGGKLPESQRDRWFDETDNLPDSDGDSIPEIYLSDAWRLPPHRS